MSSVVTESPILTVPNPRALGALPDELNIRKGTFVDLDVTGTFNGQIIAGPLVFTNSVQTLSNKSLVDATTAIVDVVDPSIRLLFDVTGTAGTAATIRSNQTANRIYDLPAVATDCAIVLTEGAQTINGVKTFANLQVSTLQTDIIDELTADHGVYVDDIRLAEDTLITPAMTLASVQTIGAAANISIAMVPKGTGSILAAIPDDAAAGGEMRGDNAVDLQTDRAVSTQVASGTNSAVLSGANNTASGDDSVVSGGRDNTNDTAATAATIGGGDGNTNTAAYSTIGGGLDNTNDADHAVIGGGNGNTSTGSYTTIGGGDNNVAGGIYSTVPGGQLCSATGDYSFAAGRQAKALGTGSVVFADAIGINFSNSTPNSWASRFTGGYSFYGGPISAGTNELIYGSGSVNTNGAEIQNVFLLSTNTNSVNFFTFRVVAKSIGGADTAIFQSSVKVKNIGDVLTLGTEFNTFNDIDAALAGTSVQFTISGINVIIEVTGILGQDILWASVLEQVYASIP